MTFDLSKSIPESEALNALKAIMHMVPGQVVDIKFYQVRVTLWQLSKNVPGPVPEILPFLSRNLFLKS